MDKDGLLVKLQLAEKYFTREKYRTQVALARERFTSGQLSTCSAIVECLPTVDTLLVELIGRLKGKPIYKTLKQIHASKDVSVATKLKGFSSLMTHTVIEMEKGNTEYGLLLPMLLEKEQELLYEL
jgi:hypothetical protein